MGVITKKGLIVQERILDVLKAESPLSTRQIALKLRLSWHTVQQHCLHLLVKKKLEHFELVGSYIWLAKKEELVKTDATNQEIRELLQKQIDVEFQNTVDALLKQFKEKLLTPSSESSSQSLLPKQEARENRTTVQSAAGGVNK